MVLADCYGRPTIDTFTTLMLEKASRMVVVVTGRVQSNALTPTVKKWKRLVGDTYHQTKQNWHSGKRMKSSFGVLMMVRLLALQPFHLKFSIAKFPGRRIA